MQWLVDDGDITEAYAVADDHDRPRSAVRIMIRDRDERAQRLSDRAIDAILDAL